MMRVELVLALALAVGGVGCGELGGGGTELPPITPGAAVWNSASRRLVAVNDGNGFRPPTPPGSTCMSGAARYTFTVDDGKLDWTVCVGKYPSPYSDTTGSRVLADGELKDLSKSLENLRVQVGTTGCGADKPLFTITISTTAGSQEYADGFYSCTIKDKPLLVSEGVDAVFGNLITLSGVK